MAKKTKKVQVEETGTDVAVLERQPEAEVEVVADEDVEIMVPTSGPRAPWASFSVEVKPNASTKSILKAAGIDWTVESEKLVSESGRKSPLLGQYRSDNMGGLIIDGQETGYLTSAPADWKPFQNGDCIDHIRDMCKTLNAPLKNVGVHRGGQYVFAVAELPEKFALFGGKDVIESYMILTNIHRYGTTLDQRISASRGFCWNQFSWQSGRWNKNKRSEDMNVKLRHNSKKTLEDTKETLLEAHARMSVYKEKCELLASKRYTPESLHLFYVLNFPGMLDDDGMPQPSRLGKKAEELRHTQPGAKYGEGTYWELYNSVTYLIDHVAGRSAETRFHSATYGPNAARKHKALEIALKLAATS